MILPARWPRAPSNASTASPTVDAPAAQRRLMNAHCPLRPGGAGDRWRALAGPLRRRAAGAPARVRPTGATGQQPPAGLDEGTAGCVAGRHSAPPTTLRDRLRFAEDDHRQRLRLDRSRDEGARAGPGARPGASCPAAPTPTRNTAMPPGDDPTLTRRQLLALSAVLAIVHGFRRGRELPVLGATTPATLGRPALHGARPDRVRRRRRRCKRGGPWIHGARGASADARASWPRWPTLGLQIVSVHLDAATAKGEGSTRFSPRPSATACATSCCRSCPPAERPTDRAGSTRSPHVGAHGAHGFGGGAAALLPQSRVRVRPGPRRHALARRADAGHGRGGMQLELDVFWAAIAGDDPVALLRRYEGAWRWCI